MLHSEAEITDQLVELKVGDREALNRLVPLVYDELRRIAHRELRRERDGHTLNTTALVHDAYVRLADQNRSSWVDRRHFFAVSATVMRRVLVDYARRHHAAKRGGGWTPVSLDEESLVAEERAEMLVALDDALSRLGRVDERLCRVVECRYFAGLTEDETADVLGVSTRTVRRDWVKAKGWLLQAMQDDAGAPAPRAVG